MDLEEYLAALNEAERLDLREVLRLLPGSDPEDNDENIRRLAEVKRVIGAMTPEERREPESITMARMEQIALASGTTARVAFDILVQSRQTCRALSALHPEFPGRRSGIRRSFFGRIPVVPLLIAAPFAVGGMAVAVAALAHNGLKGPEILPAFAMGSLFTGAFAWPIAFALIFRGTLRRWRRHVTIVKSITGFVIALSMGFLIACGHYGGRDIWTFITVALLYAAVTIIISIEAALADDEHAPGALAGTVSGPGPRPPHAPVPRVPDDHPPVLYAKAQQPALDEEG